MSVAYTYRIKWSVTGMSYYGIRYAKGCNPSELWITYFTSSKYVNEYRSKYGEPDIIQIRKQFNCIKKARSWEQKVITKLNAHKRKDYLNKTNNIAIINTEETNKKTSERMKILRKNFKNPKLSELNRLKLGDLNPSRKPEVRMKLSIIKSGTNNAMYGIKGSLHPRYGKIGASTGKKWYHDPINNEEFYFFENEKPNNYLPGRLKNKKG